MPEYLSPNARNEAATVDIVNHFPLLSHHAFSCLDARKSSQWQADPLRNLPSPPPSPIIVSGALHPNSIFRSLWTNCERSWSRDLSKGPAFIQLFSSPLFPLFPLSPLSQAYSVSVAPSLVLSCRPLLVHACLTSCSSCIYTVLKLIIVTIAALIPSLPAP